MTIEESTPGFCSYEGSIDQTYVGASNNSYINLSNDAGKGIVWAVNVVQAGTYSIQFRYANAGVQSATQGALRINGVIVAQSLPFPKTGIWTSWVNSTAFTVVLNAGNNVIRLETTTATEFANIDSLTVNGSGLNTGQCVSAQPISPNNGVIQQPQSPTLASVPMQSASIDLAQLTQAKFNVSSSGQATYQVPLILSPGSGGFAPKVALNYNSGSGNGPLGMGWSLEAAGSITRCRQSESEDKNFRPILLNADDRFCINGNKLIATSNYIYGAIGAIYKTAVDDYSQITSYGGVAGNPDYFKVEHKSGRIDYYGQSFIGTSSLAKLLYGANAISWMLTHSEDSAGNRVDYRYEKENSTTPQLAEILYAYGKSSAASAQVIFTWDSRPEILRYRISGATFYNLDLLYSVEIKNNGQQIRKYFLNYDESTAATANDNLSRLTSIQECVNTNCKSPVKFDWAMPDLSGLNASSETFNFTSAVSSAHLFTHALGDINGDGLLDIVWMYYGVGYNNVQYALAERSWDGKFTYTDASYVNGTIITAAWQTQSMTPPILKFTDYNNDGRQDLVITERTGDNKTRIFLSEPQQDGAWRLSASPVSTLPGVGNKYIFADLNGDGLQDLIRLNGGVRVRYLQPNGLGYLPEQDVFIITPAGLISPYCSSNIQDVQSATGDFNADGRMDFIFTVCTSGNPSAARYEQHVYTTHKSSNGGVELHFYAKVSDEFTTKPMSLDKCSVDAGPDVIRVGSLQVKDINNDGYDDIIGSVANCGMNQYRINTSNGFSAEHTLHERQYFAANDFVDVNGDGFLDLTIIASDGGGRNVIYVRYWDQAAEVFESTEHEISTNISVKYDDTIMLRDFDGDGYFDYFIVPRSGPAMIALFLNKAKGKPKNKIKKIVNNLGRVIDIEYEPISISPYYSYIKGIRPSSTDEVVPGTNAAVRRKLYVANAAELNQIIKNPFSTTRVDGQFLGEELFPVYNLTGSYYVVTSSSTQVSDSNEENLEIINNSATKDLQYFYQNGRFQAGGRGFLGFEKFIIVDSLGLTTVNAYRQDWPFIGMLSRKETYNNSKNILIEKKEFSWGITKCFASEEPVGGCMSALLPNSRLLGTTALGSLAPFIFKENITKYYSNTLSGSGGVESISTVDRVLDWKGNKIFERAITGDGGANSHNTVTYDYYSNLPYSYSMSMGRPSIRVVETSQWGSLGSGGTTRESSFSYYTSGSAIGLLEYEISDMVEPDYQVRTDYKYNDYGQHISSETTADGQTRRSVELEYDSKGRYVDKTYEYFTNGTDPNTGIKRLSTQVTQRDNFGTATETIKYVSTNKTITQRVGTTRFGIPYFTANSDGSFVSIDAGFGSSNAWDWWCPTNIGTWRKETFSGGGAKFQCRDIADRVIREGKIGVSSSYWDMVDIRYTVDGHVLAKSEPMVLGDEFQYWTITYYDELNRLFKEIEPVREQDGQQGINNIYYENNQVRTLNAKHQERKEIKDLLGRTSSVIDANGGVTSFTYDVLSNVKTMRDPNNNLTTMSYDLLGRKISMSDPDKGTMTYAYNHFNELICEQDSRQQTIVNSYDIRGRLTTRKDRGIGTNCTPSGIASTYTPASTTYWQYDSASNGLGQLARTYTIINALGSNPEYTQRYSYDSYGRLSTTETSLLGHLNQLTTHNEKTTYDQYGRIFQVFDAARATSSFESNGIEYAYNSTGYMTTIKDAVRYNGSQKTYYTIDGIDAHGGISSAIYGNGVTSVTSYYQDSGLIRGTWARSLNNIYLQNNQLTWDLVGNLKTRNETGGGTWIERYLRSRNISESFDYDNVNRLTQWHTSGDFSASESVTYNSIDNIDTKSGNGSYLYGSQCTHTSNAGPHATCSVGGVPYTYDKNGNLISSGGRTLQYTTYGLPSVINQGSYITSFSYNSNRARFKRVDNNSGAVTTTLYVGNVEKIYRPDNTVEWKRNIGGVVVVSQIYNSLGVLQSSSENYLHYDHLGSLSLITNANGFVAKDFYYDPWGASRTPKNDITQWIAEKPFLKASSTIINSGFTGHEHLDEVGLIHMNGRIYDPKIARFVQADPTIQNPLHVQSLNRYSYVWSNPLNATDPSGFTKIGFPTTPLSNDSEEFDEEIVLIGSLHDLLESYKAMKDDSTNDNSLNFGWGSDTAGYDEPPETVTVVWWSQFNPYQAQPQISNLDNCNSFCSERIENIQQDIAVRSASALSAIPTAGLSVELRAAFGIAKGAIDAKGRLRVDSGKFSTSEQNAAWRLASQGKNVRLRQPSGTRAEGNTSDLLVDGVSYDVYTPQTSNINRIVSNIAKKNSQAEGVVLDLSNTNIPLEQLENLLQRVNGAGATNIKDIIIMGN